MRGNQEGHVQICETTLLEVNSQNGQRDEKDLHWSQAIQAFHIVQQPPANTFLHAHFLSESMPDQRQILTEAEFAIIYLKLSNLEVLIVLRLWSSCSIFLNPVFMESFDDLNPSKIHVFLANWLLIEELNVVTEADVGFLESQAPKASLSVLSYSQITRHLDRGSRWCRWGLKVDVEEVGWKRSC